MDAEPGSAALGIFVAPGALGITLGTLAARLDSVMVLPLTLFLILLACVVYKLPWKPQERQEEVNSSFPLISSVCLFLVVTLRSFAGFTWPLPWKAQALIPLTLAVAGTEFFLLLLSRLDDYRNGRRIFIQYDDAIVLETDAPAVSTTCRLCVRVFNVCAVSWVCTGDPGHHGSNESADTDLDRAVLAGSAPGFSLGT